MNLFEQDIDPHKNRLPYNGTVYFYGRVFSLEKAEAYFTRLLSEIEWRHDEAIVFGKHIVTKRKVAWYANQPFTYGYSQIVRKALPWTDLLLEIKHFVEEHTGEVYNSCLLNLYHDGSEGMAWHSDDEKELKKGGSIASLSFGATRQFAFKHNKTKEKVVFQLFGGDLLEMKGETQSYWKHCISKTTKVKLPRVNLTFRQMEVK